VEAARRLDGVRGSEPFGAVIDELLELHRQAARATRFVFLDGPEGVGIPRIAERLAERAPVPLVHGVATGAPLAPLEAIVPALLERARRLPSRSPVAASAFACAAGCCERWFEHEGDAWSVTSWRSLAERRAAFFEGFAQLLCDTNQRESPIFWLTDVERLDAESAGLFEYLLDDACFGDAPGGLWIAPLPPPHARTPGLERILTHRRSQRIAVAALDYEGVRAYLSEPRVVRAILEKTGGLPDRIDAVIAGREPTAPTPAPAASPSPRDALRGERDPARLTEGALRHAARLAHRHALDEAAALLEWASTELDDPPDALLERCSDLHATRGAVLDSLRHAERLLQRRPEDLDAAARVGRLARIAGRLDRAEALLEEVGQRATGATRIAAVMELALVQLERAEYPRALALVGEVLSDPDAEPETLLEARNIRGRAAWSSGDLDAAQRCFTENEAAAKAHDSPSFRMRSLNNLALIQLTRGRLADARGLLTRVAQLASGHGLSLHRAIALENLGVVCRLEGRYAEAIANYQAALRVLKPFEDRGLLVRIAGNLAECFATLGDAPRARGMLELLSGQDDDGRPERLIERLTIEAQVSELEGDRDGARRLCEEALDGAARSGYRRSLVLVTLRLARYAAEAGDREGAERWLDGLEVDSERNRSRLALLRAELESDPDAAVVHARRAVELARGGGDHLLTLSALVSLAARLQRTGAHLEAENRVRKAARIAKQLELATPPELRDGFRTLPMLLELDRLRARLAATPAPARTESTALDDIRGSSPAIVAVREWIEKVAPTDATVLLTGESGTGKELAARALHALSRRAGQAFVSVNCGALVDTLLLSELFGHERGAFTGADRRKEGRFEQADGGTLFLDEVGEMSPNTQSALLRVLQERTFERVGGTERLSVDVRVIAATNRDLEAMVVAGSFRADLYYRLRSLHLQLPPLRERLEDVPEIAERLLASLDTHRTLSPDAMRSLSGRSWPGNVRELQNVLRAVAVLSDGSILTRRDLERYGPDRSPGVEPAAGLTDLYYRALQKSGSIYEIRKDLERTAVERALAETKGNISRAAALLGMKRPRLSQLASEYGLKKKNGKES